MVLFFLQFPFHFNHFFFSLSFLFNPFFFFLFPLFFPFLLKKKKKNKNTINLFQIISFNNYLIYIFFYFSFLSNNMLILHFFFPIVWLKHQTPPFLAFLIFFFIFASSSYHLVVWLEYLGATMNLFLPAPLSSFIFHLFSLASFSPSLITVVPEY